MSSEVTAHVTTSDVAAVISATAAVGSFLITTIAVYIGYRQLSAWREEARSLRRAEAAENLILSAINVGDSLDFIRSPSRRYDPNDPDAEFNDYLARIQQERSFFESLQQAKVAASVRLGLAPAHPVIDAVEKLQRLRNELMTACRMAYHYHGKKQRSIKAQSTMYAEDPDNDAFRSEQTLLIETIKERLTAIAHLKVKDGTP